MVFIFITLTNGAHSSVASERNSSSAAEYGPNESKYTVDGKVRSLTKEFGIRRATRGRRASLHIQVKRHRHQLVSYVISHVTNINNNNNRTQIPVINGNRKITWRRDELIQRYPVRN